MGHHHRIFYSIRSSELEPYMQLLQAQSAPLFGLNLLWCESDIHSAQLQEKLMDSPVPFMMSLSAATLPHLEEKHFRYLFTLCTLHNYYQFAEILLPVIGTRQPEKDITAPIAHFFAEQGHRISLPWIDAALPYWKNHSVELHFWGNDETSDQKKRETVQKNIDSYLQVSPQQVQPNSSMEYEWELQKWKQRAQLYQDFLELSKSVQQQEYFEVVDWYQQEYEALPRWYKRIGKVIKVLQGKRNAGPAYPDKIKRKTD